jgi:anthranilate phosphoribosyltransferase
MRDRVDRVAVDGDSVVDTCGTGGDGKGTFNVSTVAAFVAAGAGVRVAKHGNRSVSSRCGSAELLEALGVEVTLGPAEAVQSLEQAGLTFLFAPRYHKATRHAVEPRRAIGVRSIFNIVGPLTNPRGRGGSFSASTTRR